MGGCGEGLTNPKQPTLDRMFFQPCDLRQLGYGESLDLFRNEHPTVVFRVICQQLIDEIPLHDSSVGCRTPVCDVYKWCLRVIERIT